MSTIAIVGASLAGLHAVEALRVGGFEGDLVVIDSASELPPDRPPLSKQVLLGEWDIDRAATPLAARIEELALDLRLGTTATSLRLGGNSSHTIGLSGGDGLATDELSVDGIVLATGAAARTLSGPQLNGVHVLRTAEDCLALRAQLDAGVQRVVVVGAGFIGAEVAATCRARGHEVTMIEAAPLPLGRVLPGDVGRFVADLHRDEGVDVRLGCGVDGLSADSNGSVCGVQLADGTTIDADVVVVGIGVTPSVGWLEGSGLAIDNGVLCDSTMLAAPGVVAAGDIARWPNPHFGEEMRVEHWENAVEQGGHAGRRLLADLAGEPGEPFAPVPWFWSDQFDRKIQLAGRPSAGDEFVLVDGTVEERRFAALFRRGDRCTAVLGVNRPRHVMQARMKLAETLDWSTVAAVFGA